MPLYQVALKGDWEKVKKFIVLHLVALLARITKGRDTVLHIKDGAKQTKFVEELVYLMDARDLELKNNDDNTTLCFTCPLNKALYEASLVRITKGRDTVLHLTAGAKQIKFVE